MAPRKSASSSKAKKSQQHADKAQTASVSHPSGSTKKKEVPAISDEDPASSKTTQTKRRRDPLTGDEDALVKKPRSLPVLRKNQKQNVAIGQGLGGAHMNGRTQSDQQQPNDEVDLARDNAELKGVNIEY